MANSRSASLDTAKTVEVLNRILELELAGVVRYMHYSFMIFGHHRIPIVAWLRGQATEATAHSILAGERVTALGGHPSLKIGRLLETHKHSVDDILKEALEHEEQGLGDYRELLRRQILQTVTSPDEVDDEVRHLFAALAG